MNYIKEINAFYDWLETNSVPDSAVVLWHALMHTCNKARWVVEFAVAVSTLEAKTGLKKDAIIRARQRLKQLNRIDFRSREGKLSAVYTIIPFGKYGRIIVDGFEYFDCVVLNDTKNDGIACVGLNDTKCNTNRALSATQSATQTASINKLNNAVIVFDSDNDTERKALARDPDDEPYEFAKGIYLSPRQVIDLTNRYHKNFAGFIRLYTELSRKKAQGYKPQGSDYDELLKMMMEARQRKASTGS